MIRTKIVLTLLLLLIAITLIALHFSESEIGPHGGKIKQAGNYYIEVKTGYPYLYTFLLDNKIKPISNKLVCLNGQPTNPNVALMKIKLLKDIKLKH